MAVGGNNRYTSLQSICDLFRASINDSMAGATDTPGEGLIMTNTNPDLLTFLNSATNDVYSDLRTVGDAELILDNYLVLGLPPLPAANPTVQVSLDVIGYFNGTTFLPQFLLPVTCVKVERVWERPNGSGANFTPMQQMPFGLPPCYQVDRMNMWEMRQNAIWMPGAMVSIDLRIRCRIGFPEYLGTNINFSTTYVPIIDCKNAIVAKMLVLYARRFAPDLYPMATQEDTKFMFKLQREVNRQQQTIENERAAFGDEATASYNWNWSL